MVSLPVLEVILPQLGALIERQSSKKAAVRFHKALRGDSSAEDLLGLAKTARTPEEKGLAYLLLAHYYLVHNQAERVAEVCQAARAEWPKQGKFISFVEASALAMLLEYEEAFRAFEECAQALAQSHRTGLWETVPWDEAGLQGFYKSWALVGVGQGGEGLLRSDLRQFEAGGEKVIVVLKLAREVGQESAVWEALDTVASRWPQWSEQMEELRLYVRLMSIEDPFEGWRAVGKEISKVWPEGVSAVDAIREQRE